MKYKYLGFRLLWVGALIAISLTAVSTRAIAEPRDDAGHGAAVITVQQTKATPTFRYQLESDLKPEYRADGPLEWTFLVRSLRNVPNALLDFELIDRAGVSRFEGLLPMTLAPGVNPVRFMLPADTIPEGRYRGLVSVRVTDEPTASIELELVKTSPGQVARDLDSFAQALNDMNRHIERTAGASNVSPYPRMRLGITAAVLEEARLDWERGDWRRAGGRMNYVDSALSRVRGELTFSPDAGLSTAASAGKSIRGVSAHSGGFAVDGKPVFLAGLMGGENLARELGRMRDCGLNFAVFPVTPGGGEGWLGSALDAAALQDVSVLLLVTPPDLARADSVSDWLDTHAVLPQRGERRGAGMQALTALAESHSAVNGLAFAYKPNFVFESEYYRQEFISFLKRNYEDRDALNRSWKSRLRDFDDVTFEETHTRSSFHYDREAFLNEIGERYIRQATAQFREAHPSLALHMVFSDDIFRPGPLSTGADHEGLLPMLDISGAAIGPPAKNDLYAIDHPHNTALYAMLKSMAPENPVMNPLYPLLSGDVPEGFARYRFAHATVWDAAMAGLDALALWAWNGMEDLLEKPELVEGFSTAVMDLNRLADIVTAYQHEPADVAILWSLPSRIYDQGEPYTKSLLRAYEGATFGGRNVRFISERQCADGELDSVRVLIIPQMVSMSDAAFNAIQAYIDAGGAVVRPGHPIPYNERGHARVDVIGYTVNTVLLRGVDNSTGYLHAMETQYASGHVPQTPRAINSHGYLLEGVKSRYLEYNGEHYLYLLNIRHEPVNCHVFGERTSGYDLIHGVDVDFPLHLEPLRPLLIRLGPPHEGVPTGVVQPIAASSQPARTSPAGRAR